MRNIVSMSFRARNAGNHLTDCFFTCTYLPVVAFPAHRQDIQTDLLPTEPDERPCCCQRQKDRHPERSMEDDGN